MYYIIFIFCALLTPMLAMDDSDKDDRTSIDAHHFRQQVESWKHNIGLLNEELDKKLAAKSDHFSILLEKYKEKRSRFKNIPPDFDAELNELQKFIQPPEVLLAPNREVLLSASCTALLLPYPQLTDLFDRFHKGKPLGCTLMNSTLMGPSDQPSQILGLDAVIALLHNVAEKWLVPGGAAKGFQTAVSILRDYQTSWHNFTDSLHERLLTFSLSSEDLQQLYTHIANTFFKWPNDLRRALEATLKHFESSSPPWLNNLQGIMQDLDNLFHKRGKALWNVLIVSLKKRDVDCTQFSMDYDQIPNQYFLDASNPVKGAIFSLLDPSPSSDDLSDRRPDSDSESILSSTASRGSSALSVLNDANSLLPPSLTIVDVATTPALLPTTPVPIRALGTPSKLSSELGSSADNSLHSSPSLTAYSRSLPVQLREDQPSPLSRSPQNSGITLSSSTPKRDPYPVHPRSLQSSPALFSPSQRRTPASSPLSSSPMQNKTRRSSKLPIPFLTLDSGTLIHELQIAFCPMDLLPLAQRLQEVSDSLINASFIAEALVNLRSHYTQIKQEVTLSANPWEAISPKSTLKGHKQPTKLLSQSAATNVCKIWRKGPLCFNYLDNSELERLKVDDGSVPLSTTGWGSSVDTVVFTPNHQDFPLFVGSNVSLSLLETLFGLSSCQPTALLAIDQMLFLTPNETLPPTELASLKVRVQGMKYSLLSNHNHLTLMNTFLENPNLWKEMSAHYIVAANRQPEELSLTKFLSNVSLGEASLREIDDHSYGMEFLFSLVTGSSRPLESYYLKKTTTGTYILTRLSESELYERTFYDMQDGQYMFIGRNCLHSFPQFESEVPDSVKREYLKFIVYRHFILSLWLKELAPFKDYYDSIIAQYELHRLDDRYDDSLKITKAQHLDMTLLNRINTIQSILTNLQTLESVLQKPKVTYRQIREILRPEEAHCYDLIRTEVERSANERSLCMFLEDLLPLIIDQSAASLVPFSELDEQTDTLSQAYKYQARLCRTTFEQLVSSQVKEPFTIESLISRRPEAVRTFFREQYARAAAWAKEKREILPFLSKVLPNITKKLHAACSAMKALGEKSPYSTPFLDALTDASNILPEKANSAAVTTFHDLLENVDIHVRPFIMQKYIWWQNVILAPQATAILKSWEALTGESEIVVRPSDIRSTPTTFWTSPSIRNVINKPRICQILECTHPLPEMVNDLIRCADLSQMPPSLALEIMDTLIQLSPKSDAYHISWSSVLERGFVGLPPTIRDYASRFIRIDLLEKKTLKREQEHRLDDYLRLSQKKSSSWSSLSIASAASSDLVSDTQTVSSTLSDVSLDLSAPASPSLSASRPSLLTLSQLPQANLKEQEEGAFTTLRHLLAGDVKLGSLEEGILFDAILDLLILPQITKDPTPNLNRTPSIAVTSFTNGKSGIFHRRAEVGGDHYLVTWSDNWVRAMDSKVKLPLNVRTTLLSHSITPLCLSWLRQLEFIHPNIKLHPWFMETFCQKFGQLQQVLSLELFPSFQLILETLWPEIFYLLKNKEKINSKISFEERITSIRQTFYKGLTPIEGNNTEFDWMSRGGKNLKTLLTEVDEQHWKYKDHPPYSRDDAAIYCLQQFSPTPEHNAVIAHTLAYATNFEINLGLINSAIWQNDEILRSLAAYDPSFKVRCLQLACALRLGCAYDALTLEQRDQHQLQVSGFHSTRSGECDVNLLCLIMGLFPDVTGFTLTNNGIRSLKPFIGSLKEVVNLNLSGNPIHNPLPLVGLTKLKSLWIDNTCMPDMHIGPLLKLVNPRAELTQHLTVYSNTHTGESDKREQFLLGLHPLATFEKLKVMTLTPSKPQHQTADDIICILERLSEARPAKENPWKLVLDQDEREPGVHKSVAAESFKVLTSPFDPRPSACKLAYALSFGLPGMTIPETLGFHAPFANNAACLKRLELSNGTLKSEFVRALIQFANLQDLILNNCNLPDILHHLPMFSSLQVLVVTNNNLTSLSALRRENILKVPNLIVFDCSHNQITSGRESNNFNGLDCVLEMSKLKSLRLCHNFLTKPPHLGNIIEQLITLDISHNKIDAYKKARNVNKPISETLTLEHIYSPQD